MKINNQKQMKDAVSGNDTFIKLEEGKKVFRIVSDIHGVKEHTFQLGENWRRIACPVEMERWEAETENRAVDASKSCPACETLEGKEKDVKTQFLAIAIQEDGKIGVLKKGVSVFSVLAGYQEEGWDLSVNPISITRKGLDKSTEYSVSLVKGEVELTVDEQVAIEAFTKEIDLEQMTKPMSVDNIKLKLKGEQPIFEESLKD